MKLSCVISSGGLVVREQRVDETECKVSSLSRVTASNVQRRCSDVQRRAVEYTLKLGVLQLDSFTRLSKRKREEGRAISPQPDSAEESGQSEHNHNPSLRVGKRKENHMSRLTGRSSSKAWRGQKKFPWKNHDFKVVPTWWFFFHFLNKLWLLPKYLTRCYPDNVPAIIHLLSTVALGRPDGCSEFLIRWRKAWISYPPFYFS